MIKINKKYPFESQMISDLKLFENDVLIGSWYGFGDIPTGIYDGIIEADKITFDGKEIVSGSFDTIQPNQILISEQPTEMNSEMVFDTVNSAQAMSDLLDNLDNNIEIEVI